MSKLASLLSLLALTFVITGCNLQPKSASTTTPTPPPDQQLDEQTVAISAEKLGLEAEVVSGLNGQYTLELYLNPVSPTVSFDTFQINLQVSESNITSISNPTLSSALNQAGWDSLLTSTDQQAGATSVVLSGMYINDSPYQINQRVLLGSSTFELSAPTQTLNLTIDAENTTFFNKGKEIELTPPLTFTVQLP